MTDKCDYENYKRGNCNNNTWHSTIKDSIKGIINGSSGDSTLKEDWVSFTNILVGNVDGSWKATQQWLQDSLLNELKEKTKFRDIREYDYFIPTKMIDERLKAIYDNNSGKYQKIPNGNYVGISGDILDCNNGTTPAGESGKDIYGNKVSERVIVNSSWSGWNDILFSNGDEEPCSSYDVKSMTGLGLVDSEEGKYGKKTKELIRNMKMNIRRKENQGQFPDDQLSSSEGESDSDSEIMESELGDDSRRKKTKRRQKRDDSREQAISHLEQDQAEGVLSDEFSTRQYIVDDSENIILRERMEGNDDGPHTEPDVFKSRLQELTKENKYMFMIHSRRWISYRMTLIVEEDKVHDYAIVPIDAWHQAYFNPNERNINDLLEIIIEKLVEWAFDDNSGNHPLLHNYWLKISNS